MIEALQTAHDAARAMGLREFNLAKCRPSPGIVYALHGDGRSQLLAVGRDYRPVGHKGFADYGDPKFDRLRCDDTPGVRALATTINPDGRSNFPLGVPVPILVVLAFTDTRETYCRRLEALIQEVRG